MLIEKLSEKEIQYHIWNASTLLWAVDNQITTEKGVQLEFKQRPWLKEIFDDETPIQATNKASQVAWSNTMIIKVLKAAKFNGYNIIYTLPTFSDVTQFVTSKVNSIIGFSPLLQRWVKDKDSIFQKKVGKGFIYFRGTFSKKREKEKMESGVGIMLSADLLIHDECDRSDQVTLEQYESRLAASAYGGRWFFSNPTGPLTLSQKYYNKSDQKHWFIKCAYCNHWQYLDYYKNIDRPNKRYICQKCHKEITANEIMAGRWVKKYQNKEISGYWVNHLMCPWIKPEKLIEIEETKSKQYFYNFVLGLPYVGSEVVVDKNLILKCFDYSEPNFLEHNVLGVDSGLKKHYVLGNSQGIFKVGAVEDWEDIENIIKKFDVETAVIDALPDLTEPRKLRNKYPGKIFLHYFKKDVRKADFITWDNDTRTVYSDRTKIIQQVIDEFYNVKIRFQIEPEELDDYIKHWSALYKTEEADSMGIKRDVWESYGDNHFAFATIYFRLALDRSKKGEVKSWRKEDKIYTGRAPDIMKIAKESEKYGK